jgi:asparagine synthase (glutamine-hydrolysing)
VCGIAGVISSHEAPLREVIERQLKQLRHRGPDAEGVVEYAHAGVGQTRLAVIDVATGDPPITNEDGTVGVALNGELYNYRELRAELLDRGHRFATVGDTEVIAHLAEEFDAVELARRLDGMFSFAVWDDRRRRLMLGRDRAGKKPLYFWSNNGRFAFASEIKGLLALPGVPRELNPRAIPAYLEFGYVPTPQTFFAGVVSLRPGHVLTIAPGGEPRIEEYWSPPVPGVHGVEPLDVSFEEAGQLVRAGLDAAVRRRLIADVPLGAFLSGGVDSSAIVGLMARASERPVKTFTIGFDDQDGFDERPYARAVAKRFGTEHHEEVVATDAVELLETLVWHHDQPFGDSSAIPTYLLSQMTRRNVTVALSGDGGDELFAGYERFSAGLLLTRYRHVPVRARRILRAAAEALPPSAMAGRAASLQRFLGAADLGLPAAYRSWVGFMSKPDCVGSLDEDDWGRQDYEAIWNSSAGARRLDRLLDLNFRTYLPDDLLVKADRMSMAHGLEVRSPFLDTELIELAARLPPSMKLSGFRRKRVLGSAISDLLPREIRQRRKRGFGVPLDRWFRSDLRDYVGSTLAASDARVRSYVRGETIDRLLGEHDAAQRNHGQVLWLLLTLEVFLRREGW